MSFILGDFAFHGQNRAMSKNKHEFIFEDDSNSNGSFTSIFNNLVDSVYNFFKSLIDKIFNKNKK